MKKKLTSLILCAVLLFTCLAATSCSYNWEKDASASVTLDLAAVLTGNIVSTKKIDPVTKELVEKVLHDLSAAAGQSKDLRDTDTLMESDDTVTVTIKVTKKVDGKDTSLTPATSSYSFLLTEEQDDVVAENIRDLINQNLATYKVGAEQKADMTLVATAKTENSKTTYTFKAPDADNAGETLSIAFTVSEAKIAPAKVKIEATDIVTLYFTSKKGDEELKFENSWTYDFDKGTVDGGAEYDPKDGDAIPKSFFDYLVAQGVTLNTSAEDRTKDSVLQKQDWVKIKVSAYYMNGDQKVEIADVKGLIRNFGLAANDTENEFVQALRKDILDNLAARKVYDTTSDDTKTATTYKFDRPSTFVKTDADKAYILKDASKGTFNGVNETSADAAKTVTFEYTIDKAYGGVWGSYTDTSDNTVYEYYVAGIKELGALSLETIGDSDVANSTEYDNGDTRYLYAYNHEEKDGETVVGRHYENNQYGDELFLVKETDGVKSFVDDDGNAVKYTFVGDTAESTIDTEEKAVRYAVEVALNAYYKDARLKYITASIWKKLNENASVTVPQSLLDSYYNEFYENTRYTFYKVNNGKVETGSGNNKVTYTKFEDYLVYASGAKDASGIREAVNKKAETDLKPRLVIYAVAEKLGITVTDEEYNETVAAGFEAYYYQWMNMYYQYASYGISNLEALMENWGYPATSTVDEYVEKVLGGEANAKAGMLYDKVMEYIYEEGEKADATYKMTYDIKGPTETNKD